MIRLLPRTSDGVADLGLKSLDPWNTSESCESGLPNESEPCSPMPGGEQQIWHFCMLFFFSEHQQLHVLMSNRAAQCKPLRRIILPSTQTRR